MQCSRCGNEATHVLTSRKPGDMKCFGLCREHYRNEGGGRLRKQYHVDSIGNETHRTLEETRDRAIATGQMPRLNRA